VAAAKKGTAAQSRPKKKVALSRELREGKRSCGLNGPFVCGLKMRCVH
jgi:hypothetical protein